MTLLNFAILAVVAWIAIRQEAIRMTTDAQWAAAFERLNTATSAIAALIQKLVDQLGQGGLTADQEAAALAKLGDAATALEAMAQTPTDPVPVEPPVG